MNHIPTCGELSCDQCNERTFALLSEREELRDENIRLKAHIKRLEKSGDDMYSLLNNCDEAYRWYKAKVPY